MKHIKINNVIYHHLEHSNQYVSDGGEILTGPKLTRALANGDLQEAKKVPAVRSTDGMLFVWDGRDVYQVTNALAGDTILHHSSLLDMLVEGAELTEVWL